LYSNKSERATTDHQHTSLIPLFSYINFSEKQTTAVNGLTLRLIRV